MMQDQFLDVIDRDEAERRFQAALDLRPLEAEVVSLGEALGRVLAEDVRAPIDVPGFDRSNVDGFAVRSAETFGAEEEKPIRLRLNAEELTPGAMPAKPVEPGTATAIATGAIVPRGADAVVMIEHTEVESNSRLLVRRPVPPGGNITYAGTDIGRGETVLRRGEILTSRETGVLAAIGVDHVTVVRKPRVAILSTGDELTEPGRPMRPGLVYDSNAVIIADAVRELGGEPVPMGIVPDDADKLRAKLKEALVCDVVLLSGGTSKGAGDISYRVVQELGPPGIVAHGVALKPGKPLCLAAVGKTPVVILPGFPTSAIFTFHEFIAPIIRKLGGRESGVRSQESGVGNQESMVRARLPMRVNSERGRTEYLLVGLVQQPAEPDSRSLTPDSRLLTPAYVAYPMGQGSGSVTAFSRADGFVTIPRQREYLEAGEIVEVKLLGQGLRPADLVVIGSHCVGLDYLLGRLQELGFRSKFMAVGSTGGLAAARRGECDLAGIHLLDPKTGTYNRSFLGDDLLLIPGYGRLQGIVFRPGDARFEGKSIAAALESALVDPNCVLVNRNRGSGTRILIDGLLKAARPPGYPTEARSHNAVAAAVAQSRADWGVCIETVAGEAGLGFLPLQDEQYDFAVPRSRWNRPAVAAFRQLMERSETRRALQERGFKTN